MLGFIIADQVACSTLVAVCPSLSIILSRLSKVPRVSNSKKKCAVYTKIKHFFLSCIPTVTNTGPLIMSPNRPRVESPPVWKNPGDQDVLYGAIFVSTREEPRTLPHVTLLHVLRFISDADNRCSNSAPGCSLYPPDRPLSTFSAGGCGHGVFNFFLQLIGCGRM